MLQSSVLSLALLLAVANAQSPVYGQCGGQGWTGSTTCASGSTCVYSNPYYSQCLPGSSTPTTTGGSSTTSAPAPTGTSNPYNGGFLGGVNLAGFDFTVYINGSFTGPGYPPPTSQISHFVSQGANLFRVPTAWQLATPTLGGTLDSSWFSKYDTVIQAALNSGARVIIDIHNYARWNNKLIGESGGPTNDQFASLWSQIATKYKSQSKVIFGLMNEPHDLNSLSNWANSVQAAVTAIRKAGATSQLILIPGSSFSSAQALPNEAGPYLLKVVDYDGTVGKLIFDVHKYLDVDNSGTHTECVTDNVGVFQTLVSWLKSNGNRQALFSETGGGNTASCVTDVKSELAYVKSVSSTIIGFTAWSAGSFDTTYELTLTPFANGTDQMLWTQAIKPNLP